VTAADLSPVGDGRPFRMLSIDGGGIRGIVPTIVIAEIERRTGQSASRLFDLIAGTSTGGIIALGLAMPGAEGAAAWRAEELVEIYARDGAKMFPPAPLGELRAVFRQRYDEAPILALLHDYFGNTQLSQACCEVMVTTYDVVAREALILSNRHTRAKRQHSTCPCG
jgi:patatin-like phospholipase/acyl hydrolase